MALWRDIAGYDGLYQVNSDGRVKSLPHFVDNGRGCCSNDRYQPDSYKQQPLRLE